MQHCANENRHQLEAYLFDSGVGYEVLDAIVQANLDLSRITPDELEFLVSQFLRKPKRERVWHTFSAEPPGNVRPVRRQTSARRTPRRLGAEPLEPVGCGAT